MKIVTISSFTLMQQTLLDEENRKAHQVIFIKKRYVIEKLQTMMFTKFIETCQVNYGIILVTFIFYLKLKN